MIRLVIILILTLVFGGRTISQGLPIVIQDVSGADLETVPNQLEKGAGATVLADYASAKMIYDNGFRIEFKRHIRIKIFKSTGYGLANIQIPYSKYDRFMDLKAYTYNLDDGRPMTTAVARKQIYVEKVDPYRNMIRFTFPNIREGSVIDYHYTIIQQEIGAFRNMRFQRTIPVRLVEYLVSIPEFFQYTIYLNQSNNIQFEQSVAKGIFNTLQTDINNYKWTGKDLPPFEPEPQMPESEEYMAGVDFALTSVSYPRDAYVASPTYDRLTDELLDFSAIGLQLKNTLMFTAKVRNLVQEKDPPVKKMQAIYEYVQQHMKWNGYEQLWPDKSLIKAYQEGTGTNASINLILVNMLRTAGIAADPVVLGTRANGQINPRFALMGSLDYLICCASIDGIDYLLDATDKFRPAGMLPFKCLNTRGWVLSKNHGRWVKLLSAEKFVTQEYYNLSLNEEKELTGNAVVTFSGYNAIEMRRLIHNEGEVGFREQKMSKAGDVVISNMQFGNLDSLHLPLRITYDIAFKHTMQNVDQMIFFRPLISIFIDYDNPWVKNERLFPIDLGCPSTENLNCTIRLPDNCQPQELPKTMRIKMPGNDASFTFGAESEGNNLAIAFELNVRKTFFGANEYPSLREFYTQVSRKCNEIVILTERQTR